MKLRNFPLDRQHDLMDCGPACLKMIAKHYGRYYSLQYLRDLCGNTREGVSLAGISHGAETIRLRTLAAHCDIDDILNKVPLPAIIHWDNSHFVVLYNTKSTKRTRRIKFHVADPAKGYVTYSLAEFKDKWIKKSERKTSGIVLILEPQADFKQKQIDDSTERPKNLENLITYFTPYKKSFIYLGMYVFKLN